VQMLGTGSVICKHADDEVVTAVCCLPICCLPDATNSLESIVVTATTIVKGTHNLNIWHMRHQEPEVDDKGKQIARVVHTPACTLTAAHPNTITSIYAMPVGDVPQSSAAFVTCSKGDDTSTGADHGTIRLWTAKGIPVEELPCEASVSQVQVRVNKQGHTLIEAYCRAESSLILASCEVWNVTAGTYTKIFGGMWFAYNYKVCCIASVHARSLITFRIVCAIVM
jgi:hypothetical protein